MSCMSFTGAATAPGVISATAVTAGGAGSGGFGSFTAFPDANGAKASAAPPVQTDFKDAFDPAPASNGSLI